MSTTEITYTAKESAQLRAEAHAFLDRIPVMWRLGEGYIRIATNIKDNLLKESGQYIHAKAERFWKEANKALAWLDSHPKNCPGYRLARRAYLQLNEIAAKVSNRTGGCANYTRYYNSLYMLSLRTGDPVWTAYEVTKADSLDKEQFKALRYIQRNREWDGQVQYHITIDKKTMHYSVSIYNPKDKKVRTITIPRYHHNSVTMLLNSTKEKSWWGEANEQRNKMFGHRNPIPKIGRR